MNKQLDKNPLYLYTGSPCAICDTDDQVSAIIEGCDYSQDKVISERTDWEPKIIKPILRDISNITEEEALEVANLAWFAIGNRKIDKVEIKTTPIFPYAAIYFDWSPDDTVFDVSEGKREPIVDKFVLSIDNDHHTIKLFQIKPMPVYEQLIPMPVYQSHKLTVYLLKQGFNLGILEEGSYIIRNYKK